MYNQIRSLQSDRTALDTFPAILTNTFIQQQKGDLADLQRQKAQLSNKLGSSHPDMLKIGLAIQTAEGNIQGEIAKVVQSTRNEFESSRAQERSLVDALEQQKRDAQELNRKGIDYGVLQRDAASNRQIFESLMQRTKETGISGELRTSNIRVVDAAEVPRRPASPNKPTNLALAFFGGTAFAFCLAFFFEYLDNRIKTPDEIKAHLGLPFLGMVPALFEKDLQDPLMSNAVPANFAEAFRAIRTNVLFSSADDGAEGAGGDQLRTGRRQDAGGEQPRRVAGAGEPASADRRCRHAQAAHPRRLYTVAGAGAVERAGGQRESERERSKHQCARPLGDAGRNDSTESRGTARLDALQGACHDPR